VDRQPRVAGPGVFDGGLVVIDAHDAARPSREQVGTIALARTGLEDVAVRHEAGDVLVGHFVAPEPVVLLGDSRHGALAGQGEGVGFVGRVAVGVR